MGLACSDSEWSREEQALEVVDDIHKTLNDLSGPCPIITIIIDYYCYYYYCYY